MKLTTTAESSASSISELNILENDSLETFFDLKAELAYHSSMPNQAMKRDRYDVSSAILMRWFGIDQLHRCAVLDEYVVKRQRKKPARISTAWCKAEEFFPSESLASVVLLKEAYRKAAFSCHPDVGGNHEDMVALNHTFALLHEAVTANKLPAYTRPSKGGSDDSCSPISFSPDRHEVPEFAYFSNPMSRDELIAAYYLRMQVDVFDLESAIAFIDRGSRFPLTLDLVEERQPTQPPSVPGGGVVRIGSHTHVATTRSSNVQAQDFGRLDFLETIEILVRRCSGLNRADLCLELLPLIDKATKKWHKDVKDKWFRERVGFVVDKVHRAVKVGTGNRIAFFDQRQETNARRVAACQLKPRNRKVTALDQKDDAQNILELSFTSLPYDPKDNERPRDVERVPFLRWIMGPPSKFYSPDQSWEYHEAFYRTKARRLVEKHLTARIWALMLSLVLSSKVEPRSILKEMAALATIFPTKLSNCAKFADYCLGLTLTNLRDRIATLRHLHRNAMRMLGGRDAGWLDGGEFVVSYSERYLEIAMAPIERLQNALLTGSLKTKSEVTENRISENTVRDFLNQQGNRHKEFFEAQDRKDLGDVVRICSSYIDACLEFSPQTDHVEEFQIAYWYNQLTISLVKQGQWEQAKKRIEQLLSLPERFVKKSSDTEKDALNRRLKRCNRQLGTQIIS